MFLGAANMIFLFGTIEGLQSSNPRLGSFGGLASQAVIVRSSPTRLT